MAYPPMPQIVPTRDPKIGELTMVTELPQSFTKPRSLDVGKLRPKYSNLARKRTNGVISKVFTNKKPELSVFPAVNISRKARPTVNHDDKHLLPSKFGGKSVVSLVPISKERKACGHCEPCETIICNVSFQRYMEGDSISPLIAVNIDSSQIDAPVSKHCEDQNCDALSIDHDRCRRAVIRCHRCDSNLTCDICLVVLKTRKSQLNHKNCKMKVEYRHNGKSRGQILRDRMRLRELEMTEAAQYNRNDYTDPVKGHDRAIESLQNNPELIVIPKPVIAIQHHPTIKITSVSGACDKPTTLSDQKYAGLLPGFSVYNVPQRSAPAKIAGVENTESSSTEKKNKIIAPAVPINVPVSPAVPRNSLLTITKVPESNFVKPLSISNVFHTSESANSTNVAQVAPFLMPIRVVPITGLKTKPSLKHLTQGIPQYCLVADATIQSSSPSKIPLAKLPVRLEPEAKPTKKDQVTKKLKPGMRKGKRKKILEMKKVAKPFECNFCFKKFSTDWYFKLHIAKHKGEIKFACKFCNKPFMHVFNMKKHMVTMHEKEAAEEGLTEESIEKNIETPSCASCKLSFESEAEMESHSCGIVSSRYNQKVLDGDLTSHLKSEHQPSLEKQECEKKKERSVGRKSKTKREYQEEARRSKVKEEIQENGVSKTNKFSIGNDEHIRRLPRRKTSSRKAVIGLNESKIAETEQDLGCEEPVTEISSPMDVGTVENEPR